MCENPSDLGRQEPRGCRFIYGDPGESGWHYCQRTIIEGGKMGDAQHPPYCARHTKVCVQPHKAFHYYAGWEPNVLLRRPGDHDEQRLPIDLLLKLNPTGALSHD